MLRRSLLTILIFSCAHICLAQYDEAGAARIMKAAQTAWDAGDTAAAMVQFTTFYRAYPDNHLSGFMCLKLGELYIGRGQLDSAKRVLNDGLKTDRKWHGGWTEGSRLVRMTWGLHSAKSQICVLLSEIANRSSDHNKALQYLQLADQDHFPYFGCGNAAEDYKAFLSLKLADVYLHLGDTAKAIDRLCKWLLIDLSKVPGLVYLTKD